MTRLFLMLLILVASVLPAIGGTPDGLVTIPSQHEVAITTDNLVAALEAAGITVFARIDHGAGAAKVGNELSPTELVIFGNPKLGTKLMGCGQTVAIDLPLKALIWQDSGGQVWLSYNDPAYLAARHGIEGCDPVIEKMTGALARFSAAATRRE